MNGLTPTTILKLVNIIDVANSNQERKHIVKKILKWLGHRLKERSTYVGIATVAAAVGLPQVAEVAGQAGQIVGIVLGSGLVAATTSQHTPLDELIS